MPFFLAAAAIGSAAIGGAVSTSAANKAAKASQAASDASNATQLQMFNQTREDNAPFRDAGVAATGSLQQRLGLTPAAPKIDAQAYLDRYPDAAQNFADIQAANPTRYNGDINAFVADHYKSDGSRRDLTGISTVDPNNQQLADTPRPAETPRPEIAASKPYEAPTFQSTAAYQAPNLQPQVTYQAPAQQAQVKYDAPNLSSAPTFTAAQLSAAPTMARPDAGQLDVSANAFHNSPGYQYRQDQAAKGVLTSLAARGLSGSGAELKALSDRASNVANQDYTDFRDYTTGQYNTDRGTLNANFENDRGVAQNQWQYGNTFNQNNATQAANIANSQWQFGNSFNQNNAQFGTTAALTQRQTDNAQAIDNAQYGTSLAAGQRTTDNALNNNNAQYAYEAAANQNDAKNAFAITNNQFGATLGNQQDQFKTGLTQANYNTDRAYKADAFTGDRAYQANRYDTQTNNLFSLSGSGQAATNNNSAAAQNYANAFGNNSMSAAAATGNAAMAGAGQVNNLLNTGVNAFSYYLGNRQTKKTGT